MCKEPIYTQSGTKPISGKGAQALIVTHSLLHGYVWKAIELADLLHLCSEHCFHGLFLTLQVAVELLWLLCDLLLHGAHLVGMLDGRLLNRRLQVGLFGHDTSHLLFELGQSVSDIIRFHVWRGSVNLRQDRRYGLFLWLWPLLDIQGLEFWHEKPHCRQHCDSDHWTIVATATSIEPKVPQKRALSQCYHRNEHWANWSTRIYMQWAWYYNIFNTCVVPFGHIRNLFASFGGETFFFMNFMYGTFWGMVFFFCWYSAGRPANFHSSVRCRLGLATAKGGGTVDPLGSFNQSLKCTMEPLFETTLWSQVCPKGPWRRTRPKQFRTNWIL